MGPLKSTVPPENVVLPKLTWPPKVASVKSNRERSRSVSPYRLSG
jgi:hypothetical protein